MFRSKFILLFIFLSLVLTLVAINWSRTQTDPHHPELIIEDNDDSIPADDFEVDLQGSSAQLTPSQ